MEHPEDRNDRGLFIHGDENVDTIEHGGSRAGASKHARNATAIVAIGVAVVFGWLIGRGTRATPPPTRVLLSIESLTGGALIGDSRATPKIDGHLLVEDAPAGTTVDSVTWGDRTNRISPGTTPSPVTIETHADCRAVTSGGPPVPFPPMTAELVAADGKRTTVTVAPLGTVRWENVVQSCLDPSHPAPATSAILPCTVSINAAAQTNPKTVSAYVVTTPGAKVQGELSYGSYGEGTGGLATDGTFTVQFDGRYPAGVRVPVQVYVTKGEASGWCSTSFTSR